MCFLHIFKHYSLLPVSLTLKSLKYSLISSLSVGSGFPICTTYLVHFTLQTKIHMYLLRTLFETLYSDHFCILQHLKFSIILIPLVCISIVQGVSKNGYGYNWAITNFLIWFFYGWEKVLLIVYVIMCTVLQFKYSTLKKETFSFA